MRELSLYTRDNCHLCEDMLQELQPLLRDAGWGCRLIKVSGDPDLEQRYGARVPVLVGEDRELCQVRLDPDAVRAYLAGAT